jgi:hypothetical protein
VSDLCNVTKHGNSPYQVAVIHGGPGACGELAPVAAELAKFCGVLEPLQTATSIQEQVQELKKVLMGGMAFLYLRSSLPVIGQ